jgi:hypothetical protein
VWPGGLGARGVNRRWGTGQAEHLRGRQTLVDVTIDARPLPFSRGVHDDGWLVAPQLHGGAGPARVARTLWTWNSQCSTT